MEMAAASYIIAMTSPADTKEGLGRLVSALMRLMGNLQNMARMQEIIRMRDAITILTGLHCNVRGRSLV